MSKEINQNVGINKTMSKYKVESDLYKKVKKIGGKLADVGVKSIRSVGARDKLREYLDTHKAQGIDLDEDSRTNRGILLRVAKSNGFTDTNKTVANLNRYVRDFQNTLPANVSVRLEVKFVYTDRGDDNSINTAIIEGVGDRFTIERTLFNNWRRSKNYLSDYVRILEVKTTMYDLMTGDVINENQVPMRDMHSPKLMVFDELGNEMTAHNNETEDGTCVIDYIYNEYITKYSRNKKLGFNGNRMAFMTKEKITDEITTLWNNRAIQTCTCGCPLDCRCRKDYEASKDGVSVEQLILFCSKYKINMRALNIDGREISNVINEKARVVPPMVFVSKNGHLYPVISKLIRQRLSQGGRGFKQNKRDKNGEIISKDVKNTNEKTYKLLKKDDVENILSLCEETENVEYIVEEDRLLEELFLKMLCGDEGLYYKHKYASCEMTKLFFSNKNLLSYNKDFTNSLEICKCLDIPFENQSVNKIAIDLFKEKGCKWKYSHFTEDVLNIMKEHLITGNWVKDYMDGTEIDATECVAYDINKLYSSILADEKIDWVSFDIDNEIRAYNKKEQIDEDCVYFVSTESTLLFNSGSGFYFGKLVKRGLDDGIITHKDITHSLRGKCERTEKYRDFVKFVYDTLGNKLGKTMINSFIGLQGKMFNTIGSVSWSTNLQDAYAVFKDLNKVVREEVHNGKKVYRSDSTSLKEIEEHNFVKHRQIVQEGYLRVYDLYKKTGGDLVSVKTDCILVRNGMNKPILSNDMGCVKEEEWSAKKINNLEKKACTPREKLVLPVKKEIEEFSFEDEWNTKENVSKIIDKNCGILINARAGCGKSVLLRGLIKELENRNIPHKISAPTHIAKKILGDKAQTIHKTYGHDVLGKIHRIPHSDKGYHIIDEISMVGKSFFKEFVKMRRSHPNIKFILCGDFNQLLPVGEDDFDVLECEFLADIVSHSVSLKINKRCTVEGEKHWKVMSDAIDGKGISKNTFAKGETLTKKNLSFTNAMRKKINRKCMDEFCEGDHMELSVDMKKGAEEKNCKAQDTTIFKGLPVRSCKSKTINGVFVANGNMFSVNTFDEKMIKIVNEVGEEVSVKTEEFVYMFYPAYCLTVHSCQGQTIDEEYTLYEYKRYSDRMLYVALSRTTNLNLIKLA